MRTIKMMFATLVCLATVSLFSSCDKDVEDAIDMAGEWTGDMGMYYSIENPYTHEMVAFDADFTDMQFIPDHEYATYGTGKQVDYYKFGPYDYRYYYFTWSIEHGVIYLRYPGVPGLNVNIYEYHLSRHHFTGKIGPKRYPFSLNKMTSYYNWGAYYGDYIWHSCYYDWYTYGSKTRSEAAEGPRISDSKTPVKLGNRYMEAK